jgi:hypothetical protein
VAAAVIPGRTPPKKRRTGGGDGPRLSAFENEKAATGHHSRPRLARNRQALAASLAAADAFLTPTAVTAPGAIADNCSADVSHALGAWLNSLPANAVWTPPASACFRIDSGVQLDFPADLTIDGGTFEDANNKAPAQNGGGTQRGHPTIEAIGGVGLTLENLTIVGAHNGWSYRPGLAFQGGIQLDGTADATIKNASISRTFGDGINLEPLRGGDDYNSGQIVQPVVGLTVTDVTIRQAGRQGITAASVDGATFSDIHISGVADNAWDFEADQNNEGAKNVVIDGCTFSGINISMMGPATGPITMENCTMPKTRSGDAVIVRNTSGKPFAGPVVLADDVLRCGASDYVSCFQLHGASDLTVRNSSVTIGFPSDTIHESAYTASNGSHVTFADDVVSGFGRSGFSGANSTATVAGGTWSGLGCVGHTVCPVH